MMHNDLHIRLSIHTGDTLDGVMYECFNINQCMTNAVMTNATKFNSTMLSVTTQISLDIHPVRCFSLRSLAS